jgi:excisionase family DNA binding protein
MEQIIFDLIHVVNKMKDRLVDLALKVEMLSKSPAWQLNRKYLSEAEACRILRCSRQMLTRMRDNDEIPFYRIHRRIMYQASDLNEYLEKHYIN